MSDMGSPQRGKYSTGESVSHGALPSSRPPDHQQQQAYREQQHPQHASGPQQQHSSEQQQQYPGARPQQERVPWDGAASGPLPQRGHVSGPIPMAASHRSSSSTSTGTGGWSGNLGMGHGAYPPSPTPSSLSAPTSRPAAAPAATDPSAQETQELFREGYAFEGAAIVALVDEEGGLDATGNSTVEKKMEIVLEDGVLLTLDLDSGEKRLRELGYTQTLQRDLVSAPFPGSGTCAVRRALPCLWGKPRLCRQGRWRQTPAGECSYLCPGLCHQPSPPALGAIWFCRRGSSSFLRASTA